MKKRILLCCTGNTCRSFMAEYLLKNILAKRGLNSEFSVFSRGLDVTLKKPTEEAVQVLGEMGIKTGIHKPTRLAQRDVKAAHLILTMTISHKRSLLSNHPKSATKTYTLKEFANGGGTRDLDIADPFEKPISRYRKCAIEISKQLEKVVDRLKRYQ